MSKRRQTNAVTALAGISLTENEPENIDNKEVERLRRENARLKIASENADGSQLIGELEQKLETAIVRIDDNTLGFQRVRLHRSYADLPSDISENEVEQLGFALVDLGQNINFWLGDVVLWYFDKYNAESDKEKSDIYTWLAEKFDKSHSVLKNAVWVAGNVPASTRVDAPLSFTHYRIIVGATDNEDDVKMWANRAYENGWSRRQLEEAIKEKKDTPKLTTSDHLNKAYKSVSKITDGLIKSGADKNEIVLILKRKIEELEN